MLRLLDEEACQHSIRAEKNHVQFSESMHATRMAVKAMLLSIYSQHTLADSSETEALLSACGLYRNNMVPEES